MKKKIERRVDIMIGVGIVVILLIYFVVGVLS